MRGTQNSLERSWKTWTTVVQVLRRSTWASKLWKIGRLVGSQYCTDDRLIKQVLDVRENNPVRVPWILFWASSQNLEAQDEKKSNNNFHRFPKSLERQEINTKKAKHSDRFPRFDTPYVLESPGWDIQWTALRCPIAHSSRSQIWEEECGHCSAWCWLD